MAFLPALSTLFRAWTIPGELSCASRRTASLWDLEASWFVRLCLVNVMHAISTQVARPTVTFFGRLLCFWHNVQNILLSVLLLVTHEKSADLSGSIPNCRCFEHLGFGTESSVEGHIIWTSELWLCDELKNKWMSGYLEAIESVARVNTSTQRKPSLLPSLKMWPYIDV